MADLEFFFDPVCPWAWITSRWVTEVQQQRDYEVNWRCISLKMINEDRTESWYTPAYRASHMAGLYAQRVCDEVRLRHSSAEVGELYTALGNAFHLDERRDEIGVDPVSFMAGLLAAAGLPAEYAAHALDESHDAYIAQETELAFARTGRGVGTPIITFRPGADNEASFFGPVISTIPRGEEATKLWDAVETIATASGMTELKRTIRAAPNFE